MAIEGITIHRTHAPELTFKGELVTRAEGPRDCPDACARWHDLAVYRCTDGTWIVRMDFGTLDPQEQPRTDAEIVDSPGDVELVLACYEPAEHINRPWLQPQHETDRLRMLKSLKTNYDRLVDQILDYLQPHVEVAAQEPAAPEAPPLPTGWHRLLRLVGLRSR